MLFKQNNWIIKKVLLLYIKTFVGFINCITMKTITKITCFAAIAAMAMPISANAQKPENYKVVKVQGEIHRVKTGNILAIGEDVVSNENLSFKNNYSRAVVVNKEKGCMTLSANSENGGPQFLPSPNTMSVRAALPSQPSEVLDFFVGNVAITGYDSLKIDDDKLLIGDDSFFTVNYETNGQTINDKLILSNGKLVLPESLLQNKPEKVEICYNDEFGVSNKSDFSPIYIDNNVLKGEIDLIFNTMKGKKDAKISASVNFVNDFYGKTTPEAVESWINNNIK